MMITLVKNANVIEKKVRFNNRIKKMVGSQQKKKKK